MSLDLVSRLTLPGRSFQFPDLILLFDAVAWGDATRHNVCGGSLPPLGSSGTVQIAVRSAQSAVRWLHHLPQGYTAVSPPERFVSL